MDCSLVLAQKKLNAADKLPGRKGKRCGVAPQNRQARRKCLSLRETGAKGAAGAPGGAR